MVARITPDSDGRLRVPDDYTNAQLAPYGVQYASTRDPDDTCGWVNRGADAGPCDICYVKVVMVPTEVSDKLNTDKKETLNVGMKEEECQTDEQTSTLQK